MRKYPEISAQYQFAFDHFYRKYAIELHLTLPVYVIRYEHIKYESLHNYFYEKYEKKENIKLYKSVCGTGKYL